MVIPVQYPDVLKLIALSGGGQDEDGNWTEPTETEINLQCRFVPNGQGIKALFDGIEYIVKYKIAFPLGTQPLKIGDKIYRGESEFIVLNFEQGQLHSVAWV